MIALVALLPLAAGGNVQTVSSTQELHRALTAAKPGARILLAPGDYRGSSFANVRGEVGKPIVIGAIDPANPPRFTSGLQFSSISHVEIRDLDIKGATSNGINIDDGGQRDKPSHHVVLRNLKVSDLPQGNHDGIKLSGIDDFRVEGCTVERWGGSAIDMVGCHRGFVGSSIFRNGGDNGVQTKGGSSEITVEKCRFENPGQRGVNIGGSTGRDYFRPAGATYEAKAITVQGCTFVGGVSPIAFVGVDDATVRFNTLVNPSRWAIRILQETQDPAFVRCRRGVFEDNLVVFRSDGWSAGGVNVGGVTSPESFTFARNFWFCSDRPALGPSLPTKETGGVIGVDPRLRGDYTVEAGSPAAKVGAHAFAK